MEERNGPVLERSCISRWVLFLFSHKKNGSGFVFLFFLKEIGKKEYSQDCHNCREIGTLLCCRGKYVETAL